MPSTVINRYEYDAVQGSLTIVFVTGKVYRYKQVPEEVYRAMKNSFAKGIYFNEHIKDKYEFEKVG